MCKYYAHVYSCKHTTYALGKYCQDAGIIQNPCSKRTIWQTISMGEDCENCAVPSWRRNGGNDTAGWVEGNHGWAEGNGEWADESAAVADQGTTGGSDGKEKNGSEGRGRERKQVPAGRVVSKGRKVRKR